MAKAEWTVKYLNHAGEEREATVEVCNKGAAFYAQNLGLFGCGKDASSPIWAIKRLVNDHGTFLEASPINPV